MTRWFAVALVTIAAVSAPASDEEPAATFEQPRAGGTFSYPVNIVGGTPGVNIEIFLNGGKVGDTAAGAGGDANWMLDLSDVGKTRLSVAVDACTDGKVVKVAFVTGGGPKPPQAQDCIRRIGGIGWWSDCGVTRITINIRTWAARVVGCSPFYMRPPLFGAATGLAVLPFLLRGNDPATAVAPTNTTAQPAAPPAPATDFTVTITATSWEHVSPGEFSEACGRFTTTPAQANAPFVVMAAGEGVTQASVSGTTDAAGVGVWRTRINQLGAVAFTVTVTSEGQTRSATSDTNVTGAPNSCPGA